MELKTKVTAEEGKQELHITRDFDLPLDLLFRAYSEADILEQWMGTKVIQLENKQHGSWRFQTSDAKGNVVFSANGVIHEFVPDKKITRTFEMENMPFGIQIEFLEFEKLADDTSRLRIHTIYRSVENRDAMLKIGMGKGMDMAHNRLQDVVGKMK